MASSHSFTPYFCAAVLWSVAGAFQFGYHISALNQLQAVITCRETPFRTNGYSLPSCIPMSDAVFGQITAIFTLGGFLGSTVAGSAMGRYGRKGALKLSAALLAVGSAIFAASASVAGMLIARLLVGAGSGIAICTVPIYLTEVAPLAIRGNIGVLNQLFVTMGLLCTQLLGFTIGSPATWRYVLVFSSALAVAQLVTSAFIFDTPAWLVSQGREAEAAKASARLWGHSPIRTHSTSDRDAEREGEDEEESLLASTSTAPTSVTPMTLFGVVKSIELRSAVLIVVLSQFIQQGSGINAVMFYSTDILSRTLPNSAAYVSLIIAAFNCLMTFPPVFLVERIGRRAILLGSITGAFVSCTLLAYGLNTGIIWLSSVAIITFVGSFAVGLGPIPYLLLSELVPFHAVAPLSSLALTFNWTTNFIIGVAFLPLRNYLAGPDGESQGSIFYIFSAILLVAGALLAKLYRG
ncbi:hypothetical protein BOTBODRAFT_32044 [Botryobasidium botryosum FD-172 SS1]|uniref:Major facilitator superfamily (MFS) profile domain-containing protein n=1 Tax=Botryobasidium botryosum (strain FD-172 SS1) TaxID=930990 RepID=A0A067MHM6_BOTB1|nr:hypothetical protein BOTBODRAFT_32044 [Botryobasidium botryosum FD-172 SS1]